MQSTSAGWRWFRWPRLEIEHLWALIAVFCAFVAVSTHPVYPNDFWWHLQAGQEIAATGQIPTGETFSYTAGGQPYANYAAYWLAEWLFYRLYAWGDLPLIIFFHALLATVTYALLLWVSWQASGNWRLAAGVVLLAQTLGYAFWGVRPQALGFPLGAIYVAAIHAWRQRPRPWLLPLFPLAMVIWANCHGSYVMGLLLLGIWWMDETWQAIWQGPDRQSALRRISAPLLTTLASAAACLLNPRGVGILAYVRDLSGNPIIQTLVTEWAPPSFGKVEGGLFLGALLLVAVVLAVSPRRPGLHQILTFVAFGALALKTMRGVVWFSIAMAPVLAEHLAALADRHLIRKRPARPMPGRRVVNYAFVVLLLCLSILASPWLKHLLPLPAAIQGLASANTPIEATRFLLRERLPGPIFNNQAFGSYLIWAAQPEYPVFFDTRLELYSPEFARDYLAFAAAAYGWEEKLDSYGINTLMLSVAEDGKLLEAARASPEWRVVYEDAHAVLLVRVQPMAH